jgi:hypothetical protein
MLVAQALLLALALALPFELPWFAVGPLQITSTEALLYALLAAFWAPRAARLLRPGTRPAEVLWWTRLGADRFARAVAFWLVVVLLSATLAPAYRAAALKFALRTTGGVLLFFVARDLALRMGVALARRVGLAIVAGALVSAAVALVENAFPGTSWLGRGFRETDFSTLGLPRASGTFAYPTIAAMYWEAALPLVLLLVMRDRAATGSRPRGRADGGRLRVAGVMAASGLLVAAMLASATRTALLGAALADVAILLLGWRLGRQVRMACAGALAVAAVLVASSFLPGRSHNLLAARLQWWRDGNWFKVRYALAQPALTLPAGAMREVPISLENIGVLAWAQTGSNPVRLSYHWQTEDPVGPRLDFEGLRTPLPGDVPPGARVAIKGRVRAPRAPGRYRLRWDLVRENVTWFSERGNPTADQPVQVVPAGDQSGDESQMTASSLEDWIASPALSRPQMWAAALRLWQQRPLLGIGPDNFRHRYAEVVPRTSATPPDDRIHANSLYFETLADLGLGGIVALALIMGCLARDLRAFARAQRAIPLACAVAAATFFVHGVLDCFVEFTALYGLHWLLLGLVAGVAGGQGSASPDSTPAALPP